MTEPLQPQPTTRAAGKRAKSPALSERVQAYCASYPPSHFTIDAMVTMAYVIEQIAPDRDPLELALFMDWATGRLLGRLEQQPGMPNESDLFALGLQGIEESSRARYGRTFAALTPARRRALLDSVEDGAAQGNVWCDIPPRYFYRRFYTKVLHGMFAEKKEWVQIGILRSPDPGEQTGRSTPSSEKRRRKE
jgi:hypothetical protein